MQAIEISHLCKVYQDKGWRRIHALKEASLTVSSGESFGFVGPNGAGKSTTIKILTGVTRPSSGTARLFGRNSIEPESRLRVGYVPENPYLYDYLTPLEILNLSLNLHKVKKVDPYTHCMHWLDRFGLSAVAKKTIRKFSKGMTQRTALASALVVQPRLLILDEPLSGLDPIGRREVVDILQAYRQEGGTLFFSSHVLYDVERLADRFGLIYKGELRTVKRPDEMLDQKQARVSIYYTGAHLDGGITVSRTGEKFEVLREDLWAVLESIKAAGGTIMEISRSESLEKLFFDFVQGEPGLDASMGSGAPKRTKNA